MVGFVLGWALALVCAFACRVSVPELYFVQCLILQLPLIPFGFLLSTLVVEVEEAVPSSELPAPSARFGLVAALFVLAVAVIVGFVAS